MTGRATPSASLEFGRLAEWFDTFVGSEEERAVADAILNTLEATSAFVSTTSWFRMRKESRDEFEKLAVALIELRRLP